MTLEAYNTLALIVLVAAGQGVNIYPESLIGCLCRNDDVGEIIHPRIRCRTALVW